MTIIIPIFPEIMEIINYSLPLSQRDRVLLHSPCLKRGLDEAWGFLSASSPGYIPCRVGGYLLRGFKFVQQVCPSPEVEAGIAELESVDPQKYRYHRRTLHLLFRQYILFIRGVRLGKHPEFALTPEDKVFRGLFKDNCTYLRSEMNSVLQKSGATMIHSAGGKVAIIGYCGSEDFWTRVGEQLSPDEVLLLRMNSNYRPGEIRKV